MSQFRPLARASSRRVTRMAQCALVILLFQSAPGNAAQPGTAGFMSLRFGTGARFAGMGDTGVSLASDATAAYWNPAGLAGEKSTSIALQHNEWMETVRVESASLAHATSIGVFGLHFSGLYLDEIQRTTTASSISEGFFNVYEIAVQGGFGREVGTVEKLGKFEAGLGFKGLMSGIDDEKASGWAVDVGSRLHTRIEGLTFAAAALHLGPEMTFIEDGFELPVTLRVGGDYQIPFESQRTALVLAYDLEVVNDDDPRNHFGAEVSYMDLFSLRGGWKTGFTTQSGSFGVGVRKAGYRFDYAYTSVSEDLGSAHRFSLAIDL